MEHWLQFTWSLVRSAMASDEHGQRVSAWNDHANNGTCRYTLHQPEPDPAPFSTRIPECTSKEVEPACQNILSFPVVVASTGRKFLWNTHTQRQQTIGQTQNQSILLFVPNRTWSGIGQQWTTVLRGTAFRIVRSGRLTPSHPVHCCRPGHCSPCAHAH